MNFGSKNLYKPCSNTAYLKYDSQTSRSWKKGNDQQLEKILIAKQIFVFSTMGKVWKPVMMMFGFEGLTHYIFHLHVDDIS